MTAHDGADLERIRRDASVARGTRPFVFTDLRHGVEIDDVATSVERAGLLNVIA